MSLVPEPEELIKGLTSAAEYAGVSPGTILRWVKEGKLNENEATRKYENAGPWSFDKAALIRVRNSQAQNGRGSLKAKHLRFYDAPTGYVTAPIYDLSDPLLVSVFYDLSDSYESNRASLGASHERVLRVEKKISEIAYEIERRALSLQIPEGYKRFFKPLKN